MLPPATLPSYMKTHLLATCLLAATHLPLLAQQAAPALPLAPPTTLRQGQSDTIRAIKHHYRRHRVGGYVWLGIGTGGLVVLVNVLVNPNTTTVNGRQTSSSIDGTATAISAGFLVVPGLIGISKLTRFSLTQEAEAIRLYTTTNRLPQGWGRGLKRKDF